MQWNPCPWMDRRKKKDTSRKISIYVTVLKMSEYTECVCVLMQSNLSFKTCLDNAATSHSNVLKRTQWATNTSLWTTLYEIAMVLFSFNCWIINNKQHYQCQRIFLLFESNRNTNYNKHPCNFSLIFTYSAIDTWKNVAKYCTVGIATC